MKEFFDELTQNVQNFYWTKDDLHSDSIRLGHSSKNNTIFKISTEDLTIFKTVTTKWYDGIPTVDVQEYDMKGRISSLLMVLIFKVYHNQFYQNPLSEEQLIENSEALINTYFPK